MKEELELIENPKPQQLKNIIENQSEKLFILKILSIKLLKSQMIF